MDINVPIENPELVIKIREYTNSQSDEVEMELREALLKAKFLAPAGLEGWTNIPKGKQVLEQDVKFNLLSIQDEQGSMYLPAFTDWSEVDKWNNDTEMKTMVFTLRDYAGAFTNNQELVGIVINPYGENLVLNREMIYSVVSGKHMMKKGESVAIGLPKEYPDEMVRVLIKYFGDIKKIKSAYLLWMVRNEEQSYLLVLDSDEKPEMIYPQIGDVCKPYLNGKFVDMIPLNSSLGLSATEEQQPFYKA